MGSADVMGRIGSLAAQGNLLRGLAEDMNRRLHRGQPDLSSIKLALFRLVAVGRWIDGDFSFSGHSAAIDRAIDDIVAAAYTLAHALP